MIYGVGIDALDIARMEKNLMNAHFMERVFSEYECSYISKKGSAAASAAGIFCAKEALGKATGDGISAVLSESEIKHDRKGKPIFILSGKLKERFEGFTVHVSITHTDTVASSIVIIETP